MTKRESILRAMAAALDTTAATVVRNAALPEEVPEDGLLILRDGEPGEPDVTLNPRTEYYSHRLELEAFVRSADPGEGELALDELLSAAGSALELDPTFGGLVESLVIGAPQTSTIPVDGAAPFVAALVVVTVEYLVTHALIA